MQLPTAVFECIGLSGTGAGVSVGFVPLDGSGALVVSRGATSEVTEGPFCIPLSLRLFVVLGVVGLGGCGGCAGCA